MVEFKPLWKRDQPMTRRKKPEELSISGISEMLNAHSEYSLEYSTGELIFQGPGFAH